MSDLLEQLHDSLKIVRRNKQLEEEVAFLKAQNRLLTAKLAKERTRSDFDLSADGRPQ